LIKNTVFISFTLYLTLILAVFIPACGLDPDISQNNNTPYDFDTDNKLTGVTLRLDDSRAAVNPGSSRALSNAAAKTNYDFFEVVFFTKVDSVNVIVRTSWNIGESCFISGVPRNVNYSSADPDNADTPGNGAAVLFIGRKNSKNLLAVGLISHIDGEPNTVINTTSASVTFTIHSLEAGIFAGSLGSPASLDEYIFNETLDTEAVFKALKLEANTSEQSGSYFFKFSNLITGINDDQIKGRFAGIRVKEGNPALKSQKPKYTTYNATDKKYYIHNVESNVTLAGSCFTLALNAPLADETGKVDYNFNVLSDPQPYNLISFYYDIPVYAVISNNGNDNSKAFDWRIKPAIDDFSLELLDDGTESAMGGSILVIINHSPGP